MIDFQVVLPNRVDAEEIRRWRNDPSVRAVSLTHTKEKSEEEFFADFLIRYFAFPSFPSLFCILEGERIGVLRFDPAESSHFETVVEISIVLDKKWRGKGIGKAILKEILPFLERKGATKIKAEIKKGNEPSFALFKQAGFQMVKEGAFCTFEKTLQNAKKSVTIIAEIGSNWFVEGEKDPLPRIFEMIQAAKEAKASAVKFQMFRAKDTYVKKAGKSDYLDSEVYSLFESIELSKEVALEASKYCKKVGIDFLCSVFSVDDFAFIDPLVKVHKIASYEISHLRLLECVAKSKKPLLLSTGAASLEDIDWAYKTFLELGGGPLTLMQCTAKYPASFEAMNLNVIPMLKMRFGTDVGLSDHSKDPIIAPLGAVALGATCIEKHFTLSRKLKGPDHSFAIEPDELALLVNSIRSLELALGSPLKKVEKEEEELLFFARRRIQALRDIQPGEILSEGVNFAILRPGKASPGEHPRLIPEIEGRKAKHKIQEAEGIRLENVE